MRKIISIAAAAATIGLATPAFATWSYSSENPGIYFRDDPPSGYVVSAISAAITVPPLPDDNDGQVFGYWIGIENVSPANGGTSFLFQSIANFGNGPVDPFGACPSGYCMLSEMAGGLHYPYSQFSQILAVHEFDRLQFTVWQSGRDIPMWDNNCFCFQPNDTFQAEVQDVTTGQSVAFSSAQPVPTDPSRYQFGLIAEEFQPGAMPQRCQDMQALDFQELGVWVDLPTGPLNYYQAGPAYESPPSYINLPNLGCDFQDSYTDGSTDVTFINDPPGMPH